MANGQLREECWWCSGAIGVGSARVLDMQNGPLCSACHIELWRFREWIAARLGRDVQPLHRLSPGPRLPKGTQDNAGGGHAPTLSVPERKAP
jgi:hypothetical protein